MKKSLRRKLLLSGLAMGVAAISLASTTYAWFSKIDTVTANGATVTASVPTSIYICSIQDGSFGTSITLATGVQFDAVRETETKGVFKALTDDAKKIVLPNGTLDANLYGTGTDAEDWTDDVLTAGGNVYKDAVANTEYLYDDFWLKYEGTQGKTVPVSFVITYSGQDFGALAEHVHFEIRDKAGNAIVNGTMNQFDTWKTGDLGTLSANAAAVGYDLYIYVDHNCQNSDITTTVNGTFSIAFTKGAEV